MIYLDWLHDLPVPPSPAQWEALRASPEQDVLAFLAHHRLAERPQALATLSRHLRIPWLDLEFYEPALEALNLLTEEQARRLRLLPLFVEDERLFVATEDPIDLFRLDAARALVHLGIEPVLASSSDVERAINRHYLTSQRIEESLGELVSLTQELPKPTVVEVSDDADSPAVRLVEQLLERGVRLGATDIHLERMPSGPRLRYRLDGQLHEFPGLSDAFYDSVISRIKILSRLDISEQRAPQDGRASFVVDGRRHDLRISILPQIHGEGVAIRVLNTGWDASLGELGLPPQVLERVRQEIRRPHGLVLVTGPTGAGKTTTLYACLRELVVPQRKFISVEDPVENVLAGVNQVQVDEEAGRGFSQVLRSFLRHDPDVVMLGEIRDGESAEIAVRAAQTGHLLLSTLHTNNSLQAVSRLVELGVAPYLVLSSLNVILAQRLLRRLCSRCKQPARGVPTLPFELAPEVRLFEPVGCPSCSGIGYKGRLGAYEMLAFSDSLRSLGGGSFTAEALREAAGPGDYHSLAEGARVCLEQGATSAAEVLGLLTGVA